MTVGLCHSVQICSRDLLKGLGMEDKLEGMVIAGINHMAWLLEIKDKEGNDLIPRLERAIIKNAMRSIMIWLIDISNIWVIIVQNLVSITQNIIHFL